MASTTRNLLGVAAGVFAGYGALAVAASVDYALDGQRSFSPGMGELLLRLVMLWPFLLSASVFGLVAGAIVDARRLRPWQLAVAALAAAQYILSLHYVAPDVAEWVKTIVAIVIIAAVAAGTFSLAARRLRRQDVAQTAA